MAIDQSKKIKIPESLMHGQLETQAEKLEVSSKSGHLYIGIPKEIIMQENRVPLTPSSVRTLVNMGHRIIVECGAGLKAKYTDHEYAEAGAEIAYSAEQVYKAQVIIKAAPPTLEEIEWMQMNQLLITPLQLPIISEKYIKELSSKKITALAMEYIRDDSGSFPIVRIMSEIAGVSAMLTAGELLRTGKDGRGVLLGGVAGVPPARVVILGAGVVGEFVTRTAIGLGAEVRIFDNNIYKLMRLQNQVGRQVFTSAIDYSILSEELLTADVVIGAIHSKTGRTPIIVTENMVSTMKSGAVIIDVSIDQGGCFETSEVTSHDKPTFIKHDVIHYCVPNIPSRVSRTASMAISNVLTPLLTRNDSLVNLDHWLHLNAGLRHGVYIYKGRLTNEYLGRRFGMKSTDLDLLFTSRL